MPAAASASVTGLYSTVGASSASPNNAPLGSFVPKPAGRRSASLRASDTPLAWMPELANSTIASPGPSFSPKVKRALGRTMPTHDAARSMRSSATTPAKAGVSPPPQATPQASQAARQPSTRSLARCASSNHALPPAAQYACTDSGVAPTVIRSLIAMASVSCAISS